MSKAVNQSQYWASVSVEDIANNILEKSDKYYEYLQLSGRLDFYRRSWSYYYRSRLTGAKMNPVGQQGELTALSVNHYRNLLVHLETMTTQQRLAFEARAVNTDVKSQSQAILANGLLEYYMKDKKLERNLGRGVKDGLVFAEGFVRAEWDASKGQEYGRTETGAVVYEGDIKYSNYNPLDVIRDFTQTQPGVLSWCILRDFENKYELAAKYPDLADKILSDSTDALEMARTTTVNVLGLLQEFDNVVVYTLLHEPTAAIPQGRLTQILDNGTVLLDGPLPYKRTHVYRLAPDEEAGTIFGYTVAADLLPIQEALDMLYSTAVTNQATFGVQNILAPKGHDLSVQQISGGLNLMEYDPKLGKIESLNLTQTPAEIFNFMQMLERLAETISGVNSVARGNPEASLKSGAALALIQSMAVQFAQALQKSYVQLVEDLGTATIQILQEYAATPRVAEIAGKSKRYLLREFTGQDLDLISRVSVDVGNPLTNTTAGTVNLAESMLQNGLIDNPDQYIQVLTTGRLEPTIEAKQAQSLLIKSENERLSDGEPVTALITDNHQKHILEHSAVLSSPEARDNPELVQTTLAHIQEHMDMMNNPEVQRLAAILHQEVVPAQQQAPALGGEGGPVDAGDPNAAQMPNMPNAPNAPQGTDPQTQAVIDQQQQMVNANVDNLPAG